MRLSYAQCLEDYHLDLVLFDRAKGIYVDVGGGHPVADNVSFHFYLKGWSGIIVEPQADLARLYQTVRPRDTVINHLVGKEEGMVDFHRVDRLHGFSTIVEANARGAAEFGAGFSTEKNRIRRLADILTDHSISKVDFLKIDVEGAEADVLEGMDWVRHRPSVLCIEAIQPGSMAEAWHMWEPYLLRQDYLFAFSDGLNRFYVPRNEEELLTRFPKSPTPWDAVAHYYELGRPHQLKPEHPDRALTERLIKGFLATLGLMSESGIMALLQRSAGPKGMETGDELRALLIGTADFPGTDGEGFDDRVRAALGRIAAQYDGGMINDD